jgi:hypothetical protein
MRAAGSSGASDKGGQHSQSASGGNRMTDSESIGLMLTGESPPDVTDPDDFGVIPPNGRICQEEGGANPLPDNSHPARKYCDEHFQGKGSRAGRRRAGNNGERPPRLVVDVGGARKTTGKSDQRARDTAAGAAAFLGVIATGVAMTGDNVCGNAISSQAAAWGEAVGELSKYQPWLAQFFAPVGGDSQLGAWLGFLMVTGSIALPVMAHHGLLPDSIGAKLGGAFVAAEHAAADVPAA